MAPPARPLLSTNIPPPLSLPPVSSQKISSGSLQNDDEVLSSESDHDNKFDENHGMPLTIRIPIAYVPNVEAEFCVWHTIPPGERLCKLLNHSGIELAFATARLIYPHWGIRFVKADSWSPLGDNRTNSVWAKLMTGQADMTIPGMALSEERFRQNPHYWPMYPQRITIAWEAHAFPAYSSVSSYTDLFPLNSTLICLLVALIYNGVLFGRNYERAGPVQAFVFHERNFLVAALFYGVILRLLRSNVILAFNKDPTPLVPFDKNISNFVDALVAGEVTGVTTQRVYMDTLLNPTAEYINSSNPDYRRLSEAAAYNPPIYEHSVKRAIRLVRSRRRKYILVGGETTLMELKSRTCLRYAFFDVSPPNSEGIFYSPHFKHQKRLTEEYSTVVKSLKERITRKYARKNCPGLKKRVKGILVYEAVEGILVILTCIYGLAFSLIGYEWWRYRRHFWEVWTPVRPPPKLFSRGHFLIFRPLPSSPSRPVRMKMPSTFL